MSDVEKQIEQWRNGLGTSETFGTGDLDELEGHLREEMERLTSFGLSETEAFLVARQRLGTAEALEAEYAKINTDRRALLHLSWMAAGLLVYILAAHLAVAISEGGILAALLLHVGPAALAWIGVAIKVAAMAVLLLLAGTCARRCFWSRWTGRLWTLSWPRRAALLGGLVVAECLTIGFEFLFRAATARCVNIEEYGRMWRILNYASLGWFILLPVLAAFLALVLRTRADRYRPAAQG